MYFSVKHGCSCHICVGVSGQRHLSSETKKYYYSHKIWRPSDIRESAILRMELDPKPPTNIALCVSDKHFAAVRFH